MIINHIIERCVLLIVGCVAIVIMLSSCQSPSLSSSHPQQTPANDEKKAQIHTADPTLVATPNKQMPTERTLEKDHEVEETPTIKEEEPKITTAKLIAVGDIMMHQQQLDAGYIQAENRYDFSFFFSEIKEELTTGDWVIGNLETTLAGPEKPYTGYPQFKSPDELADAIKEAGFNLVSTANNHSLDSYESGLLRTLEVLADRELIAVGTHASAEDRNKVTIIEANEIKMAFLAYTYGTNGIPIPPGKDYLVNLLDFDAMSTDITQAREEGADLVTVSLHMGPQEYHRLPSDNQLQNVEQAIAAGADIILGGHPHVVQPYRYFPIADEDSSLSQGVVIYSLGNFISAQVWDYKDYGLIFSVQVEKNHGNGELQLEVVETIPTHVHRYYEDNVRKYRVLAVEKALADEDDPFLTTGERKEIARIYDDLLAHIESWALPAATLPSK